MPWNWLSRILLSTLTRQFARSRQRGRPAIDIQAVRSRVASAREAAGIAGRSVIVAVLACLCAALLAAGTTALVLSPRWLGGTLVGVAAALALVMVPEIVQLRRAVRARQRRLHDREVSRELDHTPPT